MIIFGLTGSIGMGKSTAASMLRRLGVPVHDSDRAVHVALDRGGHAVEMVRDLFPAAWDSKSEMIDRKKLGTIVFGDDQKLGQLENILHPLVRESQTDFIRSMTRMGRRAVALEIPLLFETGAEDRVDYVICVSAPAAIQQQRVMVRKGMSTEKFSQILARQIPDAQKRALSDFIVPTGRGLAATYAALRRILRETGVNKGSLNNA